MSSPVRVLEPQAVWNYFADLNAVPRASKKEEEVIAFARNFGESLGLETIVDEVGNVIIRKPGTSGRESHTTVVMQSHLDMVHQKNADTEFDFATQGIQMKIDEDWVKAKGTTLGADNGMGVASIMAILASTDIPHPPIEALFNLDTEEDHELTIGCAGGTDVTASGTYSQEAASGSTFSLTVKGLTGGHSGMEIHLGRGNANKLINRCLFEASKKFGIRIHSIDGGGLRNAIPRESVAVVVISNGEVDLLKSFVYEFGETLKKEYEVTDPAIQLELTATEAVSQVMDVDFQHKLLRSIYACPNGIYRMSPDIKDLVQTSNNLARVLVKDGEYQILCLTRSSVDSEKLDEAAAISSTFELMGAKVTQSGDYPGWTPKPGATIVKLMSNLYQELFDGEADVNACHAGLECGILGTNYPDMEMISFGPTIRGAHSPDERVKISSVQKFWKFLLETLNRIQ